MHRTKAKSLSQKGNRAYAFSYALSSMKAYPFRALSLALTLSLGVSLIASVMVWSDTGVHVSVNGYFESNSFQLMVHNPAGGTDEVNLAQAYIESDSLIESVHRTNSTVGIVWGTELPDSTLYGLDEPIYTDGMKDCEVIFVDNEFLSTAVPSFSIEGAFELQEGETLVSRQFVDYVHQLFGITLTINSTLDIELLTIKSSYTPAPIGSMGRHSLSSLVIVGVYEIEGYGSLIESGFPSLMRNNYDFHNYRTPVLGIRDSIMVLSGFLPVADVSEDGFFGPRAFLRASGDNLIAAGTDRMADNLLTLKARVDEQYDVIVDGLDEILELQGIVDTYVETMSLALLNLPIFILALFLSVFAADTFMAARKTEVSALRSKGASSGQIYSIFLSESIVMATLSIILGMVLSVLFAALIPSTVSFMLFDWELYAFYLQATVLKPETFVTSILITILPPLLFILGSAKRAAGTEIGSHLIDVSEPLSTEPESIGFTVGISVVLLSIVLGAVLFLPNNQFLLLLELGLGTAAWFFLAYNGSRFSRRSFARIFERASFLVGEKNLISAGNLKMRKGRIVPLMVVLALTLSSTIAFTVQAESFHADLEKEISYAVGADLRVGGIPQPFSFNDTLETYPGVSRAVPVLRTWASVGTVDLTLEALDAVEYSLIGRFDESSFFGADPSLILSELASVSNGLLISVHHADRLNKSVGDVLNLQVGGRLAPVDVSFIIIGFIHSAPGFGYASETDIPYSRLGAGFGYQAGLSGFAITNLDFVSTVTDISTASLFFADLLCVTDQDLILRALNDVPGVSAVIPEKFDLKGYSFGTALFLSTVEGLFSIGFAMSMLLSMFALTLFLGSVVRERKRDYAILRAVGASKKHIVNMVLSEFAGIVLASLGLSLVLGTVFGFVMSTIIFTMSPFSRTLQATIAFPIGFLTAALLIEVVVMVMAAYLPAREAAKTDPAIVLRNL